MTPKYSRSASQVKDELYVYQLSTGKRLHRLAPDFVGAMTLSGRRKQSWFFPTLTGFTNPGIVAKYDFGVKEEDKRWSIYRSTLVNGLNPDDFAAEQVSMTMACIALRKLKARQVWYNSKDGTRVPMFVVRHKDTKFDGTAPALQYGEPLSIRHGPRGTANHPLPPGYGGFTISINPFFSPAILTWMQKYGAILAVANIRGGGEFGEEWHLAGTRERKVGNELTSCLLHSNAAADRMHVGQLLRRLHSSLVRHADLELASQHGRMLTRRLFRQYLVDNKYAAPGKVAINGGSNGGASSLSLLL